jgi:hypothetical protein
LGNLISIEGYSSILSILSSVSVSFRGVPSSDGVRDKGGTREGVGAFAITGVVCAFARVGVGVCAVLEWVGVVTCVGVCGGGVLVVVGL